MLVLTGLTTALDRMRQLTAYARTQNPRCGGRRRAPCVRCRASADAVRPLRRRRRGLADVLADAFGRGSWPSGAAAFRSGGCVDRVPESSRYCNFHCRFCTLTAERRPYRGYDLDAVRRDLLALRPASDRHLHRQQLLRTGSVVPSRA
jgi:hypothetical protein